jgi:hypothetical protein
VLAMERELRSPKILCFGSTKNLACFGMFSGTSFV